MIINRFEIWLVSLDPTQGSEISKTRPCLIISPNSVNQYLNTVLVAPLTHTQKRFPTRVNCTFAGQSGQIALDQIRAIDKTTRLVRNIGVLDTPTSKQVCQLLEELFRY